VQMPGCVHRPARCRAAGSAGDDHERGKGSAVAGGRVGLRGGLGAQCYMGTVRLVIWVGLKSFIIGPQCNDG
jgi:hypothetical protein